MKRNRRRQAVIRNTVRFVQKQSSSYKAAAFGAKPREYMGFLNRPDLGK